LQLKNEIKRSIESFETRINAKLTATEDRIKTQICAHVDSKFAGMEGQIMESIQQKLHSMLIGFEARIGRLEDENPGRDTEALAESIVKKIEEKVLTRDPRSLKQDVARAYVDFMSKERTAEEKQFFSDFMAFMRS
jgi:predicted component of type VI protein secretion system